MKRARLLVFGLLAVIVLLVSIILFVPARQNPTAGWSTYQNAEYGFSLKYPAGAEVRVGDPQGLYLEPETGNATTVVSIVFPRVDTFSENGSHGYYTFQVRVAATKAQFACVKDPAWQKATSSDAGLGNRVYLTTQAICHNGRMFTVYDIFASGSDGTPLTAKLEADIAAGKKINEQVASSFTFLQ